ncbi:MAG: SMC-Scp complex subunit ScpB [Patescibacteria group bacterium]|nr:SMC-Scp complex subunit ScpB [Patescibacteria group bacterium]
MDIPAAIEAILFWKAEPVAVKRLAELLSTEAAPVTEDAARAALAELRTRLAGRGLALVETDGEAMLGTSPAFSPLIERLTAEELSRDLGKAGLETLSIILYQGPVSRAEIDHIRGVNSQFIVRNLLVRGLVERMENPADARSYLYKTSIELLSRLGLSRAEDLPEYEKVRADIAAYKQGADQP